MRIQFFKKVFDLETYDDRLEPLYSANSPFVVIKKKGFPEYLSEHLQDDSLVIAIDDVKYDSKDLLIVRFSVLHIANMFFVYRMIDKKEDFLDDVKEQIFQLQEADHSNELDMQNRVINLFNTAIKYKPMIGFVDNNLPYITKELCSNDMVFLIAEETREENVEQPLEENKNAIHGVDKNKKRDRSNLLWDVVFSLFVPLLLATFLFVIIESLYKKNAGLAITFIFICYVEPIILIYDSYTTYKNRTYKPFSLEKFILYGTNVIGIALGGVVSYLLGKNLFKLESNGLIRSFILIASLIAIAVIILVHIIVLLLVKRSVKKLKKTESNKDSE